MFFLGGGVVKYIYIYIYISRVVRWFSHHSSRCLSILFLDLELFSIGLNRLRILFSSYHGSLLSGRFRYLGYRSTIAQIHRLFGNISTCTVQQYFSQYSVITAVIPLRYHVISFCLFSWNDIQSIDPSIPLGAVTIRHSLSSFIYIYIYIYIYQAFLIVSSSSSSCRSSSTDIPDPLSPLLPIVHRLWQVFMATSHILTELLYVCSSRSSCFCSAICGGP